MKPQAALQVQIIPEAARTIIKLSGVLNAAADLAPIQELRGELDFYLRGFRRISSDSIQAWIDLTRALGSASPGVRIRLHECPIQLVQQANAISNLLDQAQVVSFFAPYRCEACKEDVELLLYVERDLREPGGEIRRRPPAYRCEACDGPLSFDDIPERYFMFL